MDTSDYAEKYAAQYQGADWFEKVLVDVRRRRVIASLERHPHRNVLEVGCGLEPLFDHWQGPARFTVVEPCKEFVDHARVRASGRDGIAIVEGFLEEVSDALRARQPFDFVVVSSLLHEVPDPERLLASLRGLAAPDTVLHLNVPNVRSFHRLLALEMGLIGDLFEQSEMEKKFQRTTRFDRDRFLAMLRGAGFEVLEFGTYFIKPFTHRQMEALIDRGIVDRKALEGLERMVKYMPDVGAEMFADVRLAAAEGARP